MRFQHFFDHQSDFESIAQACLEIGATAVRLMEEDVLLAVYPATTSFSEASLSATSRVGLTIEVNNLTGEPWQTCIQRMVDLFSDLLTAESEMENLTAALVETQDRLVALYDLSNATRRTFDIPALLDLLLREIGRLLVIENTFAILTRSGQASIIRQHGEQTLPESLIYAASTIYRRDMHQHMLRHSATIPISLRNTMMVSIPVREGVFASLGVQNKTGSFNAPDIKLVKALAQQIGAQLENALLVQETVAKTRMETEMNLARQVQMALMPQNLPQVIGIDLFAASSPALEVGGDFYDLVATPGRPFTFILGDVTGKGMPAALLMTMTHTVARSAARKMPFISPHQLMNRLNTDLLDDFSTVGMFTTAFIGQFDPASQQLSYCNAGQSPIFHVPANGNATLIEASDIPIGIFDGYEYTSHNMAVAAGDLFVVASDGFPETRNSLGEMFGYERMKEILQKNRQGTARQIAEALLDAIQQFSGGCPQDDDRTLIAIKVTAPCK